MSYVHLPPSLSQENKTSGNKTRGPQTYCQSQFKSLEKRVGMKGQQNVTFMMHCITTYVSHTRAAQLYITGFKECIMTSQQYMWPPCLKRPQHCPRSKYITCLEQGNQNVLTNINRHYLIKYFLKFNLI